MVYLVVSDFAGFYGRASLTFAGSGAESDFETQTLNFEKQEAEYK